MQRKSVNLSGHTAQRLGGVSGRFLQRGVLVRCLKKRSKMNPKSRRNYGSRLYAFKQAKVFIVQNAQWGCLSMTNNWPVNIYGICIILTNNTAVYTLYFSASQSSNPSIKTLSRHAMLCVSPSPRKFSPKNTNKSRSVFGLRQIVMYMAKMTGFKESLYPGRIQWTSFRYIFRKRFLTNQTINQRNNASAEVIYNYNKRKKLYLYLYFGLNNFVSNCSLHNVLPSSRTRNILIRRITNNTT